MRSLALVLLFLVSASDLCANEIRDFTTDGCSRFPDGTIEQPQLWRHCCVEHDIAYWRGGSYQERLDADKALQLCVTDLGQGRVAELMFMGVRMGGSPFWPTDYRWGYGWSYLRGYQPLTEAERQSVHNKLQQTRPATNN